MKEVKIFISHQISYCFSSIWCRGNKKCVSFIVINHVLGKLNLLKIISCLYFIIPYRFRRRPGSHRNVGWQRPEPHASRQRNRQSCRGCLHQDQNRRSWSAHPLGAPKPMVLINSWYFFLNLCKMITNYYLFPLSITSSQPL